MKEVAYVNGEFCDLGEARVSIEDRGFQFADGVYEVIVAHSGRLFRLEQHLARLKHSTDTIDLPIDYAALNLPGVIEEGVRRCGFEDVMVYLQITRGVAPRHHEFPDEVNPTIVATFKPKPTVKPEVRERGVSLKTVEDIRWAWCDVKSIALLPNVLMKNSTGREGYFDAIFVSSDGLVRETTRANVFIVTDGVLRTPPMTSRILHGVTRDYLLECARKLDIPCKECDFHVPEMLSADEVFITSTTIDVLSATSVNDEKIGNGKPGPVAGRLLECFSNRGR